MTDEVLDVKRQKIADIDRQVMDLLKIRLDTAVEIGRYKAENGLEVYNSVVAQNVVKRYRALATERGMDPDIAERICRMIMEESVANESAVLNAQK